MAKLNWERAAQRSRVYAGMGYQDLQDAADERWAEREVAREERHAAVKRRPTTVSSQRALSAKGRRALRNVAGQMGIDLSSRSTADLDRLFGGLSPDASRLRLDVGELRRRRLIAVGQGRSVAEILGAGALAKPTSKQPGGQKGRGAAGRGSSPTPPKRSKRQRDCDAAARRGISVAELLDQRRAAAAGDRELAERARELGITTKQLRRSLSPPPDRTA